ncbi:MAG: extracellular solute-binding protein [Phycisphaeraceae bacterium]|nr:MAG: extracellular solute-binding protein [Phycisphaeraceae bacterium]
MRAAPIILFGLAAGTAASLVPAVWWGGVAERRGSGPVEMPTLRFTVWGMPFEDRLFDDVYAKGYQEIAPVIVDYQRHSDLVAKYNAWHANGDGAEVMRIQITDYPQFVRRGMLEPLGHFIHSELAPLSARELANFPKNMMDQITIDGELYALPEDNAMYGLYYNKQIFDLYNAAHPGDPVGYPNEHWTWKDLREAARKLTGSAGDLFGEGSHPSPYDRNPDLPIQGVDLFVWAWPFLSFYAQAGGELWSNDQLSTLIASEAGAEALDFMFTLINDGSWHPAIGGSAEGGSGPELLFPSGRTAMLYGGSWWIPNFELQNPDLNFAVAPVPAGKRDAVLSGGVLWGISSSADNKEAAWRMVHWLVLEQQARDYWQKLRVAPPANLAVLNSDAFRTATGIVDETGQVRVPAMTADEFEDRAAWMLHTWRPDPETGRAPGFIEGGLYMQKLRDELGTMLQSYLNAAMRAAAAGDEAPDPRPYLTRCADAVHAKIDQDREANGLSPINHPPYDFGRFDKN